jgi:hypothetical protein
MRARTDLLRLARKRHNMTTKDLIIGFLDIYELQDLTVLTNRINYISHTQGLTRQQLLQLKLLKIFLNNLIPEEQIKVF